MEHARYFETQRSMSDILKVERGTPDILKVLGGMLDICQYIYKSSRKVLW